MLRQVITLLTFVVITHPVSAQASVNAKAIKTSKNTYEIMITVQLEEPWHIYSINTSDDGPFPTEIEFSKNPLVTILGKVKEEGELIEKYEEVFETTVKYYESKVVFIQRVTKKSKAKTNLSGSIEYMLCKEEQCIPPKKETFSVTLQ